MSLNIGERPPVISRELQGSLLMFLGFRHVVRQEYDKHIKVLENLIEEKRGKRDFLSREEDELQPAKDFDVKLINVGGVYVSITKT